MKKSLKVLLAGAVIFLLLAGCAFAPRVSAESLEQTRSPAKAVQTPSDAPSSGAAADATASAEIDSTVSERDASGEYDASEAVTLSPDEDLTITKAGVYILSGTYENTMIVVEAGEEDKVQLVLDNATLSNENGPAIYVRSADKVFITAAEGTVNTIRDGADYTLTDDETTLDAAVFSKADLTINGAGKLTINGSCKHAVVSKDDLVITAKALSVNAANVGLSGKDAVKLSGTAVEITAGSDGIRSENGSDEGRGYISAFDSSITVTAGKDGIQAETVFSSENCEITIVSGSSAAKSADSSESYKGIKAGTSIVIDGGSYRIDSYDDAIHTNGSILIRSGDFTIQSQDDAIHADEKAEIADGTLKITAREGIEATYVLIRGGDITIQASDDGINATRKSSAYTSAVEITGGTVTITMGAGDTDGIDSNGNIIITGGTVYVNANSSFDYDGSATFTGGTVYVNGQQVTTLPNQMMGGGRGGMGGTPGGSMGGAPGSDMGGFGEQGGRRGWH